MPRSLFPSASPETRQRLEQDSTLKLLNDFDWAANPLGLIPAWPESLKGAVRVMMAASTPMVMLIGPDGILVYNQAYAEFAGNRHPAIFGLPVAEAWPEIAEFNRHKVAMGLRGESLTLRDQELVLDRHGRLESGWMDLHYSPVLNEAGMPMGTLCMVHETTNRFLLAEERELVSQELSHRIKNIFAVLTGIVSLSARSRPEVKSFAEELRQRIYALGEAHDFVRPHSHGSHPPDNQDSLRSLIERLMLPYRHDGEDRILFHGEDATIDDGAATPLALLFHELSTNAAKYGALSTSEGRVSLTGHGNGDDYHLTWKEVGGPPVSGDAELSGFGSRLITLSIEGQLRGRLERIWEPDGLRVEIDLPVDALQRSGRLQS
ncbi:HWE histidine kinase domain-containing protein [Devosia ginsengisoli]|uniref:HWE histidine kinase domain-containing protein n=1 Tax=Devosia ginsengisoli TaxID=400770 RepID=UPI0026EEB90B|nr:HWE histidine kinase domain-containing protein [Devosia ginsengisoli]MCR6673195.1 PAS domain-containing protein [Devosia ginsengisoli]